MNKTVLITGGGRGIGRACVEIFGERGWTPLIHYNKSERPAEDLADEYGGKTVQANFSSQADLDKLMDFIREREPGTLVNNAGVTPPVDFEELSREEWQNIIDVNLTAATFLLRETAKTIDSGSIVNVTSIRGLGYCGRSGIADYCASKAGLESITATLSQRYAPEIRINAVAPGYTDTDMTAGLDEETRRGVEESTPMDRFGKPEEIAEAVYFLAGDRASYVNGETLVVDGGYSVRD
ncbi:MAG: SDR family NAD(P)-dependent oxidoreductase [bacterium]